MYLGLQDTLVRRAAINSAATSSSYLRAARDPPPGEELPASVGQGDFMIASWVVGKDCRPGDVGEKLRLAPFDCVVVVMSTAVAESDPIWKSFKDLESGSGWLASVLTEKSVHRVSDTVFVALHRANVKSCHYAVWSIRSRGQSDDIQFGSLDLHMDNSRQTLWHIRVGILDVRGAVYTSDMEALKEWLVVGRVAMLTGFFGNTPRFVEELATGAGAIYKTPLYQEVQSWNYRSRGWEYRAHPSYFLLFGLYKAISLPDPPFTDVPDHMALGDDICPPRGHS